MHVLLRALRSANTVLERVTVVFSALLVALIVTILFGGAITRFLTGIGFSVFLELPNMLMPWLIFPLSGTLLRGTAHISVDFLPDRLAPERRRLLRIGVWATSAAAGAVFCYAGILATMLFRTVGQRTEMEWDFPIWWIYLSYPVGFAILTSFALENLLGAILRDERLPDGAAIDVSEA